MAGTQREPRCTPVVSGSLRRRLPMAIVFAPLLAGCGLLDTLPRISQPRIVASLEVFNRFEEAIFLVSADGERLDVPPCGRATNPDFRVDRVEVRTAAGYIYAFGYGGPEGDGQHLVLVEHLGEVGGVPTIGPAPASLPPCRGHPPVQVGV